MLSRSAKLLASFASATSGNVAITFAFALIPLMCAVGAAVDYSRDNAVKAELQGAVDSVGLKLHKDAPTLSTSDLQTAAKNYFLATFHPKYDAKDIQVNATYSTAGGSHVIVNASVDVPTTFMSIFGYDYCNEEPTYAVAECRRRQRGCLCFDYSFCEGRQS